MTARTIEGLLSAGRAGAPAIGAPGGPALDRAGLREQIRRTVGFLNARGLGRGDRIAIVLPNGPAMASAFVSVAAGAAAAPLNPAYRAAEFRFYMEDLGARLLVTQAGAAPEALEAARSLDIPVAELAVAEGAPAGRFDLSMARPSPPPAAAVETGPAGPDDIALALHTSGTTSRPKLVPLTQANLCASAGHIAESLALGPADRCLNIMPLFHIHGLVAAVLASLAAGASVHCAPGFNALRVFAWFDAVAPSWYTAVPTMHQAILARAPRNRASVERLALRFVRSSSSSLPPQTMAALEETFGCPAIESYGMTEAAHQMTSNPLPPGLRRPGSVGVAAGPEVAIASEEDGRLLGPGETGEVVIRGPNVTPGYENNPAANAAAFANGWFRTGDQGALDADGHLRLTGRLKEIVNRGGEKIGPREIDEALMDHPDVDQAVAFAVPHPRLGEDVAAAVVLREGAAADADALRAFAARRLADFKVPRTVLIVDEIPKGATGKLQRIGLAQTLGLA